MSRLGWGAALCGVAVVWGGAGVAVAALAAAAAAATVIAISVEPTLAILALLGAPALSLGLWGWEAAAWVGGYLLFISLTQVILIFRKIRRDHTRPRV